MSEPTPTPAPTVVDPSEMFGAEHTPAEPTVADVQQPQLAENVTVVRKPGGGEFDLFVNGEAFPWFVAGDEGAQVKVSTSRMSAVTVTILAKSVTVMDDLGLTPPQLAEPTGHVHVDPLPGHGEDQQDG